MAVTTSKPEPRAPIAIIGIACRFPGDATNPSKFWDMLKEGRDGYTNKTNRYNEEAFFHEGNGNKRQNTLPVKGGYMLQQDPYAFDAAFFNITAAEAMAFDPKQRIAMEVAYEAIENAGLPLQKIAGTQTACYMGTSMSDYRDSIVRDFGNYPKYHLLGTSDEMISNRISHFLDIHGPSATIETACSSSNVATHLACQSLQSGESEMAIAGGVGMLLVPESTMQLHNLGFLSPFGQSRAFDETAGGYGRGEGCGVYIMKRLDKAIADGNPIRAIIRGSGVNQDGWTQGVTMPSGDAQTALIKYVYESNGLDFGGTQYVEAHGTGTQAGDPAETLALYRTIAQPTPSRKKLYIGSVKQNIGHLESAAGAASIIKGILAMEHGFIPPNILFKNPNPKIKLDEWGIEIPKKLIPWPACQTKRMSTSAFGMGGTNTHLVLEQYKDPALLTNGNYQPQAKKRLFTFSSHDQAGFKRIGDVLVDYLDQLGPAASSPEYLADLAHTLATARSGLSWKASCMADDLSELREQLVNSPGANASRGPDSSKQPRLGFVFTGQGAQWARMGVEMLDRKVFKESVAKSSEILKSFGCTWDPVVELSRASKESRLSIPEISQPICSVLQIALVDEMSAWGIKPTKVVGHSSGEIAAAYCIGALSHRDALAAAYYRGKASAGITLKGGMMAAGCSADDAQKIMKETGITVTVACVNSPSSVTLSGDVDALESLRAVLEKRDMFARRLKVEVAYHSSHMNSCSAEYHASIADLEPLEPEDSNDDDEEEPARMISSVTGSEVDHEALGPYYWIRNLVSPVQFVDALSEMVAPEGGDKELDILVELGPHSALGGPVKQILAHNGIKDVQYFSMLTRGENGVDTSLALAANLFRNGVSFEVSKANDDQHCRILTHLPPYPWNHTHKFRAESRIQRELVSQKVPTKGLLGAEMPSMDETERVWRGFIRLDEEPWLRDHTVGSTVLFPGAAVVSVVLEAAQQMVDPGKKACSFTLRDISFMAMMALSDAVATEIIVHMRPHLVATTGSTPATWWEFTVSSCAGPTGQLRNNCRGLISIDYEDARSAPMIREDAKLDKARTDEYRQILNEHPETVSKQAFYDMLAKSALQYGEVFQGVENCHPGNGKTAFEVKMLDLGETRNKQARPFLIHGAFLDSVLQAWAGSTQGSNGPGSFGFEMPMLPKSIGEMTIAVNIPGDVGYMMPGFARSRKHGFTEWSAEITMLDRDISKTYLSIKDFRLGELEVEDEPSAGGVEVDPAAISSQTRWDYSLDLLEPNEVSKTSNSLASAMSKHGSLDELVRMAIHQRPSVDVIEVVGNAADIPGSLIARLPKGTILPAQVRYALLEGDASDTDKADTRTGQPYALGPVDHPLPANLTPADLVVIPYFPNDTSNHLRGNLNRLMALAKPEAVVLIVSTTEEVPLLSSIFKGKGFQSVFSGAAGCGDLALSYFSNRTTSQPQTLTNGHVGQEVVVIEPSKMSSQTQAFSQELQEALKQCAYTVSTKSGLEHGDVSTTDAKTYVSLLELETPWLETLSEAQFEGIRSLVQSCDRLLWVTRSESPSFRLVDGFARVMRSEFAGLNFQTLHLSSKASDASANLVSRILLSNTNDNEFAEKNGLLQISRVYRDVKEDDHIRLHLRDTTRIMPLPSHDQDSTATALRLCVGKPGLLNTLHFAPDESMTQTPLADDEVELQVKASGINFRDIMGSMGLLPVPAIGQEASGVVLRTGKLGAQTLKPGDRVSTLIVGGTHATKIRCHYRVAQKIPDNMSFEEAAGVPVTHCTAYYALVKLAKLQRGQSVLIHAAAGGTGQAAIQLAHYLGLTVYATVGTDEKRQLLKERYGVPDEHIFNSRDTSFAKGIHRVTGGRGVDCVLNSLSGELLRVSFGCLATFGTFVEIGLRDITDNTRLDMKPFAKSTTFAFINMVTFLQENPDSMGEILHDVFDLIAKGDLRPAFPIKIYPVGQVEDAFRLMQQGKHLGKMILSFTADEGKAPVLCRAKDSLRLDPAATYLFVGGLGGLGRSLALEFIASGARNFAFMSRSGDSKPAAKAVVTELEERGATVKVYAADAADEPAFESAMAKCSRELPVVKGVIQMAMVLRDVVFEKMKHEEWVTGLRPKVDGTWNLHKYFDKARPLDWMIFCSSVAGTFGNPSQAQYAAGNTFQDALAHYRRAHGLKAVSVNLGIMRDVGVIAEGDSHFMQAWEEALGIREPVFHALTKSLINGQQGKGDEYPPQVTVGLGTGDIIAANNLKAPAYFEDPRFGPLAVSSASNAGSASSDGSSDFAARLSKLRGNPDLTEASVIITEALVKTMADILRMPPSEVDPSRPMYRYGVDSLVALEVRNWITKEMKANMTLLEILAAVPMEEFASQIAKKSKLLSSD
ncbi:KR domain-containing protein [Xylariaceae sp. FL1019]|nr:KR domain-containing protein [Xylariaceae sp. FL1019]